MLFTSFRPMRFGSVSSPHPQFPLRVLGLDILVSVGFSSEFLARYQCELHKRLTYILKVTGCSSGIGAALATRLTTQTKSRVVATARKVSALSYLADDAPNVLKVALDVTSPEAIDVAFTKAVERFGRVDVVVNNAGYTIMGDTEASTAQEARDLFDTDCEFETSSANAMSYLPSPLREI